MMQLARRAPLVVALLLLTGVGTASAECAWVLWAHWGGGLVRRQDGSVYNPYQWQVVDAYQARDACVSAQRSIKLCQGYDRALCLPDTVKPEGAAR
jgi:hypothetical protein